jgi:hypothetical protein
MNRGVKSVTDPVSPISTTSDSVQNMLGDIQISELKISALGQKKIFLNAENFCHNERVTFTLFFNL